MTAFSNDTEFQYWAENWCKKCIKDDLGLAPLDTWCPILSITLAGNEVPPAWTPGTDDLRDRYHCKEFEGES